MKIWYNTCNLPFSRHWFSTLQFISTIQNLQNYRLRLFEKIPQWSNGASSTEFRKRRVSPDYMLSYLTYFPSLIRSNKLKTNFNTNSTFQRKLPDFLVQQQLKLFKNLVIISTLLLNFFHQSEKENRLILRENESGANKLFYFTEPRVQYQTPMLLPFLILSLFFCTVYTHTHVINDYNLRFEPSRFMVAFVKTTQRRVGVS